MQGGWGLKKKWPQIFQGKLSLCDFPWGWPIILMSKSGPWNFWGLKGGPRKIFVMKSIKLVEVHIKCQMHEKRWTMKQLYHIWGRDQFKTCDQKVKLPKKISRIKYVFETEIGYRFQFCSQKLNLDFKSEIRNEILNLKFFHIDLHRATMVKNVVKMGQIDWNERILGKTGVSDAKLPSNWLLRMVMDIIDKLFRSVALIDFYFFHTFFFSNKGVGVIFFVLFCLGFFFVVVLFCFVLFFFCF